jgi:transposase
VRATTLLNRVLDLPKTAVRNVEIGDVVTVWVRPQQRVMFCPYCDFRTRRRYDTRVVDSSWRHLDLGGQVCVLRLRRRRLRCPEHGVVAESVPFARSNAIALQSGSCRCTRQAVGEEDGRASMSRP